jgi:hypothetical protein
LYALFTLYVKKSVKFRCVHWLLHISRESGEVPTPPRILSALRVLQINSVRFFLGVHIQYVIITEGTVSEQGAVHTCTLQVCGDLIDLYGWL